MKSIKQTILLEEGDTIEVVLPKGQTVSISCEPDDFDGAGVLIYDNGKDSENFGYVCGKKLKEFELA